MSAVGFDFRNESCVVAVAKHTSIMCFDEEQRFLGIAGAATSTENPRNSISLIMRLIIGRSFSDPELQQDLKSLPFSVTEGPDGFPLIHALYHGETKSFTPIQVMGMVFSNMKKLAEKNLNASVVNCCIGIPIYFTDLQRRAVIDAATLAGLNPLRLMHETTATAMAYGIYKTDLSENKELNVAFVDIGYASTQVCIAGFKKGQMKILAHSFDHYLGGRDFDEVLFQHFAEQFKADYKIDVFQNSSACIKLRAACEKLKKVLRSNPEAPLYVECLIDDKYVRGFIKRDEFEQISKPILDRIKKPLEKALSGAKLTVDDIYALEVVCSDSWVIKILAELFGKKPSCTMNANECVSRGCALECAILSPNFGVREFQVQESFSFSIAMQWKDFTEDFHHGKTENLESRIIFPRGNPIPSLDVQVQHAESSDLQAPPKTSTYTQDDLIEERYKEHSERESFIEQLTTHANWYKQAASSVDPKYEHIDLSEKLKVLRECLKVENWLIEKKLVQESLPKHADPVLLPSDIRKKAEALDRVCRPIMSKPKPATKGSYS